MKLRLDKLLVEKGLASTRSQAESSIKLKKVTVDGKIIDKPGALIADAATLHIQGEQYVSRAALKLLSIKEQFELDFRGKVALDVGSSTGGFTELMLRYGAKKVYAVDVGTDQLHPKLRADDRVELHEKTDIREFTPKEKVDCIVADVSFISLRHILPHLKAISSSRTIIVVMCKPQFEADKHQVNKGVIKNSAVRRSILKDFELWLVLSGFIIKNKADSQVAGAKGNVERFYYLEVR